MTISTWPDKFKEDVKKYVQQERQRTSYKNDL